MPSKFRFLFLLLTLNFQGSLSLEVNPPQTFSVISLPQDVVDDEPSNNVVQELNSFAQQPKLHVEIQIHDVNGENTIIPTEQPSWAGMMDKMQTQTLDSVNSRDTGIRIIPRGRSGVMSGNSRTAPYDVPITWEEAYSSVKRAVVVRSRSGASVPHNRNIVQLQPIVPTISTPQPGSSPTPPPHDEVAKMARFIVHNSNWTSAATISTRSPIAGFPFVNIFSVSDGTLAKPIGVPYMYMTPLDISVIDWKENSRSSLTMSLAQGEYCKRHNFDPEDPRCARVILTGNIIKLTNSTAEGDFAKKALFDRHPDMQGWPKDHGWFFAKLDITHILVLDYFGGAKSVSVEDYFAVEI